MGCDYQTLFIVVVGTATSQYLVWYFVRNQLCIKHFEQTLWNIWNKYYKDACCQNYDLWKQNSASRIKKRLLEEQQNLVLLFYLWNLMWIIMLCFCLPRVWALSLLSVMTTYGFIVLTASYMVHYILTMKLERKKDTLPNFYI